MINSGLIGVSVLLSFFASIYDKVTQKIAEKVEANEINKCNESQSQPQTSLPQQSDGTFNYIESNSPNNSIMLV